MPASESLKRDRVDNQLLHALLIDGRASFSLLADVIGASEQTIARRYRRLQDAGALRVLVLPAPVDTGMEWMVRIGVRPGAAQKLAAALAQRDDVSWVRIGAGGSEVVCISTPSTTEERDALLLERLARTNLVTTVQAHAILKVFAGMGNDHWSGFEDPLDPAQQKAVRSAAVTRNGSAAPSAGGEQGLGARPEDDAIFAALREDGRASFAQLAAAANISPARAARRLTALIQSGQAYVHVDIATDLLGFPTAATVWLSVAPAELERAGARLGALSSTTFVAAVTGAVNLTGSIVCRSDAELYSLLTDEIGSIKGVQNAEISPVIRRVKQASTVLRGARLRL